MTLMRKKIFGPILPIKTFSEVRYAIDFINGQPKPLALNLFRDQTYHVIKVLKRKFRECALNTTIAYSLLRLSEDSSEGVKQQWNGKSSRTYGFLAFSNEKGVQTKNWIDNATLVRPPYGAYRQKNYSIV